MQAVEASNHANIVMQAAKASNQARIGQNLEAMQGAKEASVAVTKTSTEGQRQAKAVSTQQKRSYE